MTISESLARQLGNSIETLKAAMHNADDETWVYGSPPFYQIVFHAIYSLDMYCSTFNPDFTDLPDQYTLPEPFRDFNKIGFFDEEINEIGRISQVLTRDAMIQFLSDTRSCIRKYFSEDITSQFQELAGFPWLNFTKFELVIHNIRHITGHTGVLNQYLKANNCEITGWIGRKDL